MKSKFILLSIVFLAIFLRFNSLTEFPDGVHIDEASYAYNAYSIIQTNKDEFGNSHPLFFESEDDYKLPVHIYLSTIPVKLFGLNEFSSRFTAAFFGLICVVLIYLISYEIIRNRKVGLMSSFVLAISPWHILFSRTSTDVMTGTAIVLAALLFFIKYIKTSLQKNFIIFLILYILSFFTYRTTSIFILIFFPFLILYFSLKKIAFKKQDLITFVFINFILLAFIFLTSQKIFSRLNDVNIFKSDERMISLLNGANEDGVFQQQNKITNVWISRIFHNKLIESAKKIVDNYFSEINPSFIFVKGDASLNNATPGVGNLYIFEFFFICLFLYILNKKNKDNYFFIIPVFWILFTNIPSSVTVDAINSSRTLQAVIGYALMTAVGMYELIIMLNKHKNYLLITKIIIVLIYFLGISYFLHQFFVHKSLHEPWYRNVGVKEAIDFIQNNKQKYSEINFESDIFTLYLYFSKINPVKIQNKVNGIKLNSDKRKMKNIDAKFKTGNQGCKIKNPSKQILYVCFGTKIPKNSHIIKVFRYKDEQPSVILITGGHDNEKNLPKFVSFY